MRQGLKTAGYAQGLHWLLDVSVDRRDGKEAHDNFVPRRCEFDRVLKAMLKKETLTSVINVWTIDHGCSEDDQIQTDSDEPLSVVSSAEDKRDAPVDSG